MTGKVFINYRRDDSIATAGRLHDRLARVLGRARVFMDIDHIPPGVDFEEHLSSQLSASSVFLAVIGPGWLNATNESGRRRLYDPRDIVAIEIVAALNREIRVIPVLVDGARMPKSEELPDDLRDLTRRNAFELRNMQFGSDVDRLLERVREVLPKDRRAFRRFWASALALVAAALLVTALAAYQWGLLTLIGRWATLPIGGQVVAVENCDRSLKSANPDLDYSGVFVGLLDDAQGRAEVQIRLARNGNTIVGNYLREGLCGKIFGEVVNDRILFRWTWAGAHGSGAAVQSGKRLSGTSGFNDAVQGGGTFVLFQR